MHALSELEKMKRKEEELQEKHEGERDKILGIIYSELKTVEETFREKGREETYPPKITKWPFGISLSFPIVQEGRTIGLSIGFRPIFTEKGYGVTTRKDTYDRAKNRFFTTEGFVEAPVTAERVRKEIRDFLRDRSFAIKTRASARRKDPVSMLVFLGILGVVYTLFVWWFGSGLQEVVAYPWNYIIVALLIPLVIGGLMLLARYGGV